MTKALTFLVAFLLFSSGIHSQCLITGLDDVRDNCPPDSVQLLPTYIPGTSGLELMEHIIIWDTVDSGAGTINVPPPYGTFSGDICAFNVTGLSCFDPPYTIGDGWSMVAPNSWPCNAGNAFCAGNPVEYAYTNDQVTLPQPPAAITELVITTYYDCVEKAIWEILLNGTSIFTSSNIFIPPGHSCTCCQDNNSNYGMQFVISDSALLTSLWHPDSLNEISVVGAFTGNTAPFIAGFTADVSYLPAPQYSWTPQLYISDPSHPFPVVEVQYNEVQYIIEYNDGYGCIATDTIFVGPLPLTADLTIETYGCGFNSACADTSLTSAVVLPTGGCSPYDYFWSDGTRDPDADSLLPGPFCVTISDNSGEFIVLCDTIQFPQSLTVANVELSEYGDFNISCGGEEDGYILIDVAGGADCEDYFFEWSKNGNFYSNEEDLVDIPAGVYSLAVTDINGCIRVHSFELTEPDPLLISINTTEESCLGNKDASIELNLAGGMEPYEFLWSQGDTTQNLDSIGYGQYIVTVTDSNSCQIITHAWVPLIPFNNQFDTLPEDTCDVELFMQWADQNDSCSSIPFPSFSTSIGGNGTLTPVDQTSLFYCPTPNFAGEDTVLLLICDLEVGGPGLCDTNYIFIHVFPFNDAPQANNDALIIPEDITDTTCIPILSNDIEFDGDDIFITYLDTTFEQGFVQLDSCGVLFIPDPDYAGTVSLSYVICDLENACDTASIVISVTPSNDLPILYPESDSIEENSLNVFYDILANDVDVDGDSLTICGYTLPLSGGDIEFVDSIHGFLYSPPFNWSGADTIEYCVCDQGLPPVCDTTYLAIYVIPDRFPPVAVKDTNSVMEDTPALVPILDNDYDPNGDDLIARVLFGPFHGTDSITPGQLLFYSPAINFWGIDSLRYEICDVTQEPLCDTTWSILVVEPVNDPPTASDDFGNTCQGGLQTYNVTLNDVDLEGDAIYPQIIQGPLQSEAWVTGQSILLISNNNYEGTDTVVYAACDDSPFGSACDTALLVLAVCSTNEAPVAKDDHVTLPMNGSATIPFLSNDYDPNLNKISFQEFTSNPFYGQITLEPDSTLTYTPQPDYAGKDLVFYTICDDGGPVLCDTAIVHFEILYNGNLVFPNALTPNGDGNNDGFYIKGLEYFPENEMIIYNRWGRVVYRKTNYTDEWIGQNQAGADLPSGTYFYSLKTGEYKKPYSGFVLLMRGGSTD